MWEIANLFRGCPRVIPCSWDPFDQPPLCWKNKQKHGARARASNIIRAQGLGISLLGTAWPSWHVALLVCLRLSQQVPSAPPSLHGTHKQIPAASAPFFAGWFLQKKTIKCSGLQLFPVGLKVVPPDFICRLRRALNLHSLTKSRQQSSPFAPKHLTEDLAMEWQKQRPPCPSTLWLMSMGSTKSALPSFRKGATVPLRTWT